MRCLLWLIPAVALFVGGACGKSMEDRIVGRWSWESASLEAANVDYGVEFGADGSFRDWFEVPGKKIESYGTYTIQGNTMTITETRWVMNGNEEKRDKTYPSQIRFEGDRLIWTVDGTTTEYYRL